MGNEITIAQRLQEPFDIDDLEWRVQRCGITANNKPWAMVVAYVTNRAIQQRLDDILGFDGWQNEYKPSPDGKGFLCGISIRSNNEWITKWDGAENTSIEPLKGGLSGAMKRAAVQLGIGRYLYNLETVFAVCNLVDSQRDSKNNYAHHKDKQGNHFHIDWGTPDLPEWALPNVQADSFVTKMKESESLIDLKDNFKQACLYYKSFNRFDLEDRFIKAKDHRKAELDEQSKLNVERIQGEAQLWLDNQLKALELVPDQSSVVRVSDSIRDHLNKISEGQYYDVVPMHEQINDAQKSIIENLKTPEEADTK